MHRGGDARQRAVARHRIEHPRLAQQHDQNDRGQTEDDAEFEDRRKPRRPTASMPMAIGSGTLSLSKTDPGEHEADRDVENGADDERAEDADRHVALRIFRLLRRRRHRVEADIGENTTAAPRNTPLKPNWPGPTWVESKRRQGCLRSPMRRGHERRRRGNEHHDDHELDRDQHGVRAGGFTHADDSNTEIAATTSIAGALMIAPVACHTRSAAS